MGRKLTVLAVLILVAILALISLPARAIDNVTPPAGGGFYDGTVDQAARTTLSNNLVAAMTARADTNVTTTATTYTPRRTGDVLVGGAGSGTNAVWVSKGVTTNDWVQIKP